MNRGTLVAAGLALASGFACGAAVNPTVPPDVSYVAGSTRKIAQLIGDTDFQWLTPTPTRTLSRVGIIGSDLGVSFQHKGATWLAFGDTQGGGILGDRDPLAFTSDTDLAEGLDLTFLADGAVWRPITIPGISQGAFEVPMEGVSFGDRMYLYHTTDHSASVTMGRSVVAVSEDDGRNFRLLYTFSTNHFINLSATKVNVADWPGLPQAAGEGVLFFGSGSYRASNVRLAFQPAADLDSGTALAYFAGLDASGRPTWSAQEADAIALFDQPCVGELSVGWNKFIRRWVMFYNCNSPRGINFRTACQPWGPWTTPQVLFQPWNDLGYAHFMHVNWTFRVLDNVHNPTRQNEWGGEYGPYMFRHLVIGTDNRTTIYFTMSTWNPYVSVLMQTELTVANVPNITVAPRDQRVMAGEPARFELAASAVGALSYRWQRDGTTVPGATSNVLAMASVNADDDGAEFRCVVSNASGSVTSNPVRLLVIEGNQAPVPVILAPAAEDRYSGGQVVSFHGMATDAEDGLLPADAFQWRVTFHHGNHIVPFLGTLAGVTNGAFAVPVRGEQATNVFYRVWLTVTDSGGRQATAFRDIPPRTVSLSLTSEPAGLQVRLDGQTFVTPAVVGAVVGMKRALAAVTPGSLAGRVLDWREWLHHSEPTHTISVPPSNTVYRAVFRAPTILIATNSVWKYLVTPSAPASTWKAPAFNDATWSAGPAQLGYGDGDEATSIGFGPDPNNRYLTTYFRQTFNIVDPTVFGAVTVRLLRDDGGVVYLNGTEIFRSNLGGGLPLWTMQAPTAAQPADETSFYYSTNVPPGLLRAGANVVAAEIHQNATNSSDLSFALELRATERDPRLTLVARESRVALSWPYPSAGYVLQSTPQLEPGPAWTTLNLPVVLTNNRNQVTLTNHGGQQFFRLRKP